jgi:hypothetical protein
MAADSLEFHSLFALIVGSGVPIPVLAEAVERHGIYVFDRFGRFKCFKRGSHEAERALDALAEQHRTRADPDVPDAVDAVQWEGVFDSSGWPAAQLPDFQSIEPNDVAPPPTRSVRMERPVKEQNLINLIGGLLVFIKGAAGTAHPDYRSEAALQEWLERKIELPGMGSRTVQDVFKQAKDSLVKAGLSVG